MGAAADRLGGLDDPDTSFLRINLRYLRALSAVASAGSIAAAAEGLFRVSSAVTRSISELETTLGRKLFERHPRGMMLTPCGAMVLKRAQRIEQEFDLARAQLVARGGIGPSVEVKSLFASILNGRRLAVFASLAEKRNMPTVAREFGITQPGVSTALKDLESGLGVRLMERSARGLNPTVAGDIVAFYFKRALAELRHIVPDILAQEGTLQGDIHIGALPLGRTRVVPAAIARLLEQHQGLRVFTVESPYEALAAGLRSGDIDFIFGALRSGPEGTDLHQESLFEDQLSVIARADHPLARSRRLDFDTLRQAQWVLSRRGSPSRELLELSFLKEKESVPVPSVETGDLAVLRGLLLESDMITAISAHQLRYEIQNGSLVILRFLLDDTKRDIGLIQRVGAFPSPGTNAMLGELRRVVAEQEDFRPRRRPDR